MKLPLITCRIIFIITALAFAFTVKAADRQGDFDAANHLYEQGKFTEASAAYDGLLLKGMTTEQVLFNAGNAAIKNGNLGKAIFYYREAQLFEPSDADLKQNLLFARAKARGGVPSQELKWQRPINVLSLNAWTLLFALSVWAALLMTAMIFFKPPLKPLFLRGIPSTLVMVFIFGAGFGMRYLEFAHPTAIVTIGEAEVHNGPLDEAQTIFKVRDGLEMTLLDTKDDWFQVSDSTDRVGWIRKQQVAVFDASKGVQSGSL